MLPYVSTMSFFSIVSDTKWLNDSYAYTITNGNNMVGGEGGKKTPVYDYLILAHLKKSYFLEEKTKTNANIPSESISTSLK